jgi:hypothetical protein
MPKIPLDVILRTYTGPNVHKGNRFVPFGKEELMLGCIRSLVVTLADAADIADVRVTILDDHSEPASLEKICAVFRASDLSWKLVPRTTSGNPDSFYDIYTYAREHARDLIYFVEDDYLHSVGAVREMVEEYVRFKERLGKSVGVGLVPYEHPDLYLPEVMSLSRVVLGKKRHWRTIEYTTSTMLVSRELLLNEWYKFLGMSSYGKIPEVHEGNTINKIWREGNNFMFSPMPTLAIHMQFSENIPPYVDWKEWWEKYSK